MAARTALGAILCACLIPLLGACGSSSTTRVQQPASTPATTTWVVLIDLSQSTLSARRDYMDALARVLGAVRPGDSLTILSIEQSSVENAQFLYQGTFPKFHFVPSPPPDTDNPLVLQDYRAREKKRRASEQAQFDRAHDLAAELRNVRSRLAHKVLTYSAPATDIFGALLLAGNEFSVAQGPHRLIMLTDGVVVSGGLSFARQRLSHGLIKHIASTQKREHRLPALHGARVLIIGARFGDALDFARLSNAWCFYIDRFAGGHLQSRYFMSRLSDELFSAWLRSGEGS